MPRPKELTLRLKLLHDLGKLFSIYKTCHPNPSKSLHYPLSCQPAVRTEALSERYNLLNLFLFIAKGVASLCCIPWNPSAQTCTVFLARAPTHPHRRSGDVCRLSTLDAAGAWTATHPSMAHPAKEGARDKEPIGSLLVGPLLCRVRTGNDFGNSH